VGFKGCPRRPITVVMEPIAVDATAEGRHICCTKTTTMLRHVQDEAGDAAVEELIRRAGSSRTRRFLETEENWISLDEAVALLEALVDVTGDPDAARRVGARTVQQHAGTGVSTLLRSLGSPEAVLGAIAATSSKLSTATEMESLENAPGRCVVRAAARPGFTRHRLHCEWATGVLSTPTNLFGLPPADVEEITCQARGDAECRYIVTWDAEQAAAGADPQQRVTALEAQLIAMKERLRGVFATAGELLSADDLDVVLARIVERAAQTVRAPRYVLAVRAFDDDDPRIYSDGVPHDEAAAIAAALEAGGDLPGSALTAEVASSRRAYGWLCALYPEGNEFFAQEQELFSLYATHAAAVLDMATALADSARRHEHVSALLSLSQDLARGGSSQEVADGLAAAMPAIVDCDRTSVWLWDDAEQCLRAASTSGMSATGAELLRGRPLRASDSVSVATMREDPRPLSFTSGQVDDAFLQELLTSLGVLTLVVVPIIARDEFLGILTAAVTDRSERLALTSGLLERLNGIAALAAPAIQNGRLIDDLQHAASHDPLTGLSNRAGFGRRMSDVLDEARRTSHVGLLFVDLDGFKQVNDVHGHDIGDALLQQAAQRLGGVVRAEDTVARLGGDEFAVILTHVCSSDEVAAAARRVRAAFDDPFTIGDVTTTVGASVGEAGWPADGEGVEALLKHADAAMYREKMRTRAA
jgi:diguanylate cyclase (GGDEF)-like protein